MKREKIYTTPYNGIINNKLVLASFLNRIFDITFTYKLFSDLVDWFVLGRLIEHAESETPSHISIKSICKLHNAGAHHLPHSSLYTSHFIIVSQMTEHDSTKPPPVHNTTRSWSQYTTRLCSSLCRVPRLSFYVLMCCFLWGGIVFGIISDTIVVYSKQLLNTQF